MCVLKLSNRLSNLTSPLSLPPSPPFLCYLHPFLLPHYPLNLPPLSPSLSSFPFLPTLFLKHADVFVVGVRNDYLLYCYSLESGSPVKVRSRVSQLFLLHASWPHQTREINMNALGDDFVSFTAMYCSFSPDDKYILLSTGEHRACHSLQ